MKPQLLMEPKLYNLWFGLEKNPFNQTSNPRYFVPTPCHMKALDYLLSGIKEREAFYIITGEAGTGKTILLRSLSRYLDTSIKTAFILQPIIISDLEFLKKVNEKFGVVIGDSKSKSIKNYSEALNHFLVETFHRGGSAVLIIDEAQSLSFNVLEKIRALSKLEFNKKKLIQIVLSGQPMLKDILAAPPLNLLDEHIKVYCDLKPLDFKGLKKYIEHRLLMVGSREKRIFTNQAIKRIYSYSQGNPAKINAVCDLVIYIATRERKFKISKTIAEKAIKTLQGDISMGLYNIDKSWKRFAPMPIILLLFFMFVVIYTFGQKKYLLKTFSKENNEIVLKIDKDRIAPMGAMLPKNKVTLPIQRESSKIMFIGATINKQAPNTEGSTKKISSEKKYFSIQTGAFLYRENAENLSENLKRKGYTPHIVEALDYAKRKWYAVRMMRFNDFKDAYITAAEFRKKERKPAIVTVIDSLEAFRPEREEFEKVTPTSLRK